MTGNDAHKEEEKERVKKCPFLNEWCIKDKCALWREMARSQSGLVQKFGMCAINAHVMLL